MGADSYSLLKYQLGVWCEKCVAGRHYGVIGKQLFISNDRQRVRWEVVSLSQDGVCTDSVENFSMKSLKRDQSNDTKFNLPLFSLVNTFKKAFRDKETHLPPPEAWRPVGKLPWLRPNVPRRRDSWVAAPATQPSESFLLPATVENYTLPKIVWIRIRSC